MFTFKNGDSLPIDGRLLAPFGVETFLTRSEAS